ncbi:unnamed protein product [Prunus brigantina]
MGVLHQPKGSTNLKAINREFQLIHEGLQPLLTHTFRFHHPPQREKRASCKEGRAWSCPGNYIAASYFSLLFIPSMYLLSSVFIVMSS